MYSLFRYETSKINKVTAPLKCIFRGGLFIYVFFCFWQQLFMLIVNKKAVSSAIKQPCCQNPISPTLLTIAQIFYLQYTQQYFCLHF